MAVRNIDGKHFTRNLYLVAYLHLLKYEIEIKSEFRGRFSFWVTIDDKLEDVLNEFYLNKASVEPLAYSFALKEIKSRMYENIKQTVTPTTDENAKNHN